MNQNTILRLTIVGLLLVAVGVAGCRSTTEAVTFRTLDTDFSKGRLTHEQTVGLSDLVKFHGHLCDGLVVGALALQEALHELYPDGLIDRTNLRVVSQASPCLTDAGVYLTGGRYQFSTFYVDTALAGLYVVQRLDNHTAVRVAMRPGVKPAAIDSLGALAVAQRLSACQLDTLKRMEDAFTADLLQADPHDLFIVEPLDDYDWQPIPRHDYTKTDILNRAAPPCQTDH